MNMALLFVGAYAADYRHHSVSRAGVASLYRQWRSNPFASSVPMSTSESSAGACDASLSRSLASGRPGE